MFVLDIKNMSKAKNIIEGANTPNYPTIMDENAKKQSTH